MGDIEPLDAECSALVPTPRDPVEADGLPGAHREWVTARGQVSGLWCALREAETDDGAVLPAPLGGGVAQRSWGAVSRDLPGEVTRGADPDALRVVGHAARVLGHRLCRWRVSGVADLVTAVLRDEAALHEREPEWLVAQVARVHGVLSAPDPLSAAAVWRALHDDSEETPWTT